MEENIREKLNTLEDYISTAMWNLEDAINKYNDLYSTLQEKNNNCIKDINTLKRELKRDGLYTEGIEEFLENYMKYYNK